MPPRTNREFVMLAHVWNRNKDRIAGMMLSEKLDGMRAIWLPATRHMDVRDVPFANRAKDKREILCTGLWSKYGKVIHAPDYFLDGFPQVPLDGELWFKHRAFQETLSIVRTHEPDERWKQVKFYVLDSPRYMQVLKTGTSNNPQYKKKIVWEENQAALKLLSEPLPTHFELTYKTLQNTLVPTEFLRLHEQKITPFKTPQALEMIDAMLADIEAQGGEGVIIRHPASHWDPIRTRMILKAKSYLDDEGTVVGYTAGEGKYSGMMGSVLLEWNGKRFNLSGFTDDERQLMGDMVTDGEKITGNTTCPQFPVGSRVTFRYRELSDDGVPKEARYDRPEAEQ